eukprot:CAMPEP_0194343326 /NCGR_PEP_ID=MMETSP0171-20130528/96468_1 /TAXON_ID=218684 /ORGANISM="Corethron pennatum, Strain L29A3" /LENGTH=44 /DNA_ID= /DNA_START= /DNA_END= /DNA_ORIENTATION=
MYTSCAGTAPLLRSEYVHAASPRAMPTPTPIIVHNTCFSLALAP